MKNVILLFVLVITLTGNKPNDLIKTIDITTAIENGIIGYTFKGNSESPHYYQPISITLNNLTDESIIIKVPIGQTFISSSTDHQDVIVTKEEMITLSGKGYEEQVLFGMCIQQSNAAPDKSETYHLGEMSRGNLVELCKEIQNRKAFHAIGQNAVWALTDHNELNDINGFDKEEATHIKTFVAGLLGVSVPDYPKDDYYTENNDPSLIKRRVGGRFKYRFSKTSAVTIGMFDGQGIIVRELYSNPTAAPGERILKYEFDAEVYTDKVYYIRMIVDGQIKINFEMKS